MKTIIQRLLIAAVLAVAAWLSRSESQLSARVADTREQVATLHYADADTAPVGATLSDYLPGDQPRLRDEMRLAHASVSYWLGRYGEVTGDTSDSGADAQVLLTAANAAYREAQRDPGTGLGAVQKLDGVLQAYASALKATAPSHALASVALAKEAAYNYEFVARVRDQVARAQGKNVKPVAPPALLTGDLPVGPTIHGSPGGPPPDAKMEDLKMIAPMEYGDREAQPEATPGGKKERKG